MHHNADFDSHEILSSLLSIGKNNDDQEFTDLAGWSF